MSEASTSRVRVAIDAMGGDNAPGAIVAGALQAVDELGVDVVLVGLDDAIRAELPNGVPPTASRSWPARR